jgi:hypothetical protein
MDPDGVTIGTPAGVRDTNALGKREDDRLGYLSRSGSRTVGASRRRTHWSDRRRVHSCAHAPPLLLLLRPWRLQGLRLPARPIQLMSPSVSIDAFVIPPRPNSIAWAFVALNQHRCRSLATALGRGAQSTRYLAPTTRQRMMGTSMR